MNFAAAFRQHVTPALRTRARTQGLFIALGLRSFSEAYDEVFEIARKRGALHISDSLLEDLEEWIATEVLTSCEEFEPMVLEHRQIAGRVAQDIADCEAKWSAMMKSG